MYYAEFVKEERLKYYDWLNSATNGIKETYVSSAGDNDDDDDEEGERRGRGSKWRHVRDAAAGLNDPTDNDHWDCDNRVEDNYEVMATEMLSTKELKDNEVEGRLTVTAVSYRANIMELYCLKKRCFLWAN